MTSMMRACANERNVNVMMAKIVISTKGKANFADA